jgi:competence protein ComEA
VQLVEVNTASEADLDSLRGLGPAQTRRILAARQDGPFAHWPDLQQRVKGLGPALARQLCEQGLRVAGSAQACTERR